MQSESLRNKRYLALVRCSTMAQAGTSTDDQEKLIVEFGRSQAMIHVATIRLDGQSGLALQLIDNVVHKIIERKQERGDFDVVIVQDSSRLTRSGGEHGHHVLFTLRQHGIRVVNAANHIENAQVATMVRTMEFEIAHGQVQSQSFAIARGLRASLESRSRTHCNVPPYGIDREIVAADGTPLYRIRNKSDGSQVKVKSDSEIECERLPATKKGEPARKHRKAKHERARLVPGDLGAREVVARIYRRRFQDDIGTPAIARELNQANVLSPQAWRSTSEWTASTVQGILDNPIYSGLSVGFRTSSARLFRVGVDGPEVAASPAGDMEMGKPRQIGRQEEVWVRSEEESLKDYLPPDLQVAASAHHRLVLQRAASGWTPRPRHDPHRESDFILKGLLQTSSGLPMSGTKSGRRSEYRHYRVHPRDARKAGAVPPKTRVPAGELERQVLLVVQNAILQDPLLEQRIASALEAGQDAARIGAERAAGLEAERKDLMGQILYFAQMRTQIGDTVVTAALAQLEPKLKSITTQLSEVKGAPRLTKEMVAECARDAAEELRHRVQLFDGVPAGQLRSLLHAVIAELRIDLETCELRITLRLPDDVAAVMGPHASALYRPLNWTHQQLAPLSSRHVWQNSPCCRRKRHAA